MQQDDWKNRAVNKYGKTAGQEYITQTDGPVLLLQQGGRSLTQQTLSAQMDYQHEWRGSPRAHD